MSQNHYESGIHNSVNVKQEMRIAQGMNGLLRKEGVKFDIVVLLFEGLVNRGVGMKT